MRVCVKGTERETWCWMRDITKSILFVAKGWIHSFCTPNATRGSRPTLSTKSQRRLAGSLPLNHGRAVPRATALHLMRQNYLLSGIALMSLSPPFTARHTGRFITQPYYSKAPLT